MIELTDTTGLGRIKVLLQGRGVPEEGLTGLQTAKAGHD